MPLDAPTSYLLSRVVGDQPLGKVVAYHGTRTSALRSILDNGILAHPFRRYHPSQFYQGQRGASVYVTENPDVAREWALSEVDDPSQVTILQVELPADRVVPDEQAPEAERFVGDVPAAWIRAAYPLMPDGSLGPAIRFPSGESPEDPCKRLIPVRHGEAGVPAQDSAKLPKGEVDYEHPAQGPDHCSMCDHWRFGACEVVEGAIEPEDWCDRFAPVTKMASDEKMKTWKELRFKALPEILAADASFRRAAMQILKNQASKRPVIALDWKLPQAPSGDVIAMDRDPSLRVVSKDGHLHVALSNISKATVNPYIGSEIPDFEKLGLDPNKKYMLLRDPDELKKAAPTFNNLPILAQHVPISAAAHRPDLVIGSTGTDAVFQYPYLKNSLAFWTQPAIDAIENGEMRELSSAYHYTPVVRSGVFEGKPYSLIMTKISGNHVALVPEGRAGSDVKVAA